MGTASSAGQTGSPATLASCAERRGQQPVGPDVGVLLTALRMTKRPWEEGGKREEVALPLPTEAEVLR
jgi:hypothetical protein